LLALLALLGRLTGRRGREVLRDLERRGRALGLLLPAPRVGALRLAPRRPPDDGAGPHPARACPARRAAADLPVDARALLDHVGQLVGEQALPGLGLGVVGAGAEVDVRPAREGERVELAGGVVR